MKNHSTLSRQRTRGTYFLSLTPTAAVSDCTMLGPAPAPAILAISISEVSVRYLHYVIIIAPSIALSKTT